MVMVMAKKTRRNDREFRFIDILLLKKLFSLVRYELVGFWRPVFKLKGYPVLSQQIVKIRTRRKPSKLVTIIRKVRSMVATISASISLSGQAARFPQYLISGRTAGFSLVCGRYHESGLVDGCSRAAWFMHAHFAMLEHQVLNLVQIRPSLAYFTTRTSQISHVQICNFQFSAVPRISYHIVSILLSCSNFSTPKFTSLRVKRYRSSLSRTNCRARTTTIKREIIQPSVRRSNLRTFIFYL